MSDNPNAAATGEVPYQSAAVVSPPEQSPSASGGGLLTIIERLATRSDLNLDTFDRLLKVRREEEDRQAERSFNRAMSLAKGELEPVIKTNLVEYSTAKGRTRYKYEAFADVARAVDPVFARHGLAYRFSQAQNGDLLTVTCIISHADGFSERTMLQTKVDPGLTGMSNVQALGSALTYLQRYSLRAAIGLAAGVDDDGRGGSTAPKINAAQAQSLQSLIEATGRSQATLLRLVGVNEVADMNVDQWTRAMEVLDLARAEKTQPKRGPVNAPGD